MIVVVKYILTVNELKECVFFFYLVDKPASLATV